MNAYENGVLNKNGYLFILVASSSCSKELIETKEDASTITSPNTKVFLIIDANALRRVFNIDQSFTKNRYLLDRLANQLNYSMPGVKVMFYDFLHFARRVTLVYDDKAKYSYYGKYEGGPGNAIVLNSLDDIDAILEEFFHAYWALWVTQNGSIPLSL